MSRGSSTTSRILACLLVCLLITGCKKDDGPIISNSTTIKTDDKAGTLQVIPGSALPASSLRAVGFGGSSAIDQSGHFQVSSVSPEKYQIIVFNSTASGNTVYMGMYNPETKSVMANDTSTVLSLLLMNPSLMLSDQIQRKAYVEACKQNAGFSLLLTTFRTAVQTNPDKALDFTTNPTIYQMAVEIMKESIESLEGQRVLGKVSADQAGGTPSIEDASGDNITFVNPRHVWYGAGIYPNDQALSGVVPVKRQAKIVGLKWAWPPIAVNEPARTDYALGNGYFRISLSRGLDFSKILQINDPVGRATLLNTAELIIVAVDLIMGHVATPQVATLVNHLHISSKQLYDLSSDILKRDALEFLRHFFELVWSNKEEICLWIWEGTQNNAAHEFLGSVAGLVNNLSLAMKVLAFANGPGPFIYDLIFAPNNLNFYVTQANGTLTANGTNEPPVAAFSVNPPAGIITTTFTFNASPTTDDNDALSALSFRWDWDSDGTWDTNWSSSPQTTHVFSTTGAFAVTLEAKDSKGVTATVNKTVNVGGGQGSAKHVKLFMDNKPWSSSAMTTMLASLGFTPGQGDNTYEILTSDQMATVSLLPGTDLVIIANDQAQTFYQRYANSQIRFANFAFAGGALFWEACDLGWNQGSMSNAGVLLPGNLTATSLLSRKNYIPTPSLPLVTGLPTVMDHNYASHESFSNLPNGTTVYCTDSLGTPTLIEFNLGSGWVIVSGQPLEHQYDRIYGQADMEKLLPRIVAYFTGKTLSKVPAKAVVSRPDLPSHVAR